MVTDLDHPRQGFTHGWIRSLAKHVEWVHVMTMWAGRVEVPENVAVFSVGREQGFSEARRAIRFYRHLAWTLRQKRPDVAFAHMIPIFAVMAAPLLRLYQVPLVVWYAHPSLTNTLRLAHTLADRVVSSVPGAYPYQQDKVAYIGQGIDTRLFAPDGQAPDWPPVILCAGRLSPVKDHPTLLRAVQLLRERWAHPFRAVIIGDPVWERDQDYVDTLQAMVRDLDIEDSVVFVPSQPRSALQDWYRRSTVYVNLTPRGSGDKVALEAMSAGCPSLVANPGFRITLGDYADVLTFRRGDAKHLAERLQELLNMPRTERRTMGMYLREQVVALHSLDTLGERLTSVFYELVRV